MKLAALTAVLAAGLLVGGSLAGSAADTTTTETTTEVTTATTTAPETTTEVTTSTVQQTTTRTVARPAQTTTVSESSASNTPAWVWVIVAALAVGVIGLVIALFARRRPTMPPADRRRRLDGAIGSWVAQGWAVESQAGDSAVLRRGAEVMQVAVDEAGGITTRPLSA